MKQLAIAAALCLFAAFPVTALAKADCKANAKTEWMSKADAKTKTEAQGYTICPVWRRATSAGRWWPRSSF